MELKYAVAILKGDIEKILGLFDTKEEADRFGTENPISHDEGLQYCLSTFFKGSVPAGDSIKIYSYYNA